MRLRPFVSLRKTVPPNTPAPIGRHGVQMFLTESETPTSSCITINNCGWAIAHPQLL